MGRFGLGRVLSEKASFPSDLKLNGVRVKGKKSFRAGWSCQCLLTGAPEQLTAKFTKKTPSEDVLPTPDVRLARPELVFSCHLSEFIW